MITTWAWEGGQKRTQSQAKMAAWNSFSYICNRALHSLRSFAHCRSPSTVIPLLPKATFTPSFQPNLGLPRTRPPLTSAINTLLVIRPFFNNNNNNYSELLCSKYSRANQYHNNLVNCWAVNTPKQVRIAWQYSKLYISKYSRASQYQHRVLDGVIESSSRSKIMHWIIWAETFVR